MSQEVKEVNKLEEVFFTFMLFLLSVVLLCVSFSYPRRVKLLPLIILIPLVSVLGRLLLKNISTAVKNYKDIKDIFISSDEVIAMIWVIAMIVLFYFFGLVLGAGILPFIYMKIHHHEKWKTIIITSIILPIGIFSLFKILGIPLYQGILLNLIEF